MTRRKKLLLWIGAILSLPAAGYAGTAFIFYAWLSAADPQHWPPERAALWAYSALALAVLFFASFVYCVLSLIKESNRASREEQRVRAHERVSTSP